MCIGNVYREQKRRGTPPPNIQYRTLSTKHSAEKHPSPLYMYRESQKRLDQLHSALVLFATANHRKTTVQQIILRNRCVLALNLHTVH